MNRKYNPERTARNNNIFTDQEISILWEHSEKKTEAAIILILLYSGRRLNELKQLKKENVHLDKRYLYIRHNKVTYERFIPIAKKVTILRRFHAASKLRLSYSQKTF